MISPEPSSVSLPDARQSVVVAARRDVSSTVVEFALRRPDGTRLPDWAPGAHIDVILPPEAGPAAGAVRQYSLCGDRRHADEYRIAVQREAHQDGGRGGSEWLTEHAEPGTVLGFGGPRNNFRLAPADEYLFVAGGIGITPILPMIAQADVLGIPWRLLYLGRTRDRLAYLDELGAFGTRVTVHCADEQGRADLGGWIPHDARVRTYACGPARLLDAVAAWPAADGGFAPRVERFTADARHAARPASRFEVIASRSQRRVSVAADESIADALRAAGVGVLTSCSQGLCGTCETTVLRGTPDHRDALLDDDERAAGNCLFPCVSRSLDAELVLDI